ncbi:hypothetical protein SAY86_028577 [Trapa natans]|uniref:Protein MIZU-KUSSEI 1 n=1 Tax=Trapa natans TaxID=22666 RepID=A0AAN7MIK2_TRANT|nr:hypothetical protein SAY86_028577 [Trapa natans]
MPKINAFRCFILPCYSNSSDTAASSSFTCGSSFSTAPVATTSSNRISNSLRDSQPQPKTHPEASPRRDQDSEADACSISSPRAQSLAPPRPSKTVVIGTIFGPRRGHVWFCIHHDRFSTKLCLLLELSIPTNQLVKEMQSSELVRIALECSSSAYATCPLRSVPMWTLFCNGKKLGFAVRRKSNDQSRAILKAIKSMTVGTGVIPASLAVGQGQLSEEIMYMRANYEHIVGSANAESFHLISPDHCPGQELSVFLLRS